MESQSLPPNQTPPPLNERETTVLERIYSLIERQGTELHSVVELVRKHDRALYGGDDANGAMARIRELEKAIAFRDKVFIAFGSVFGAAVFALLWAIFTGQAKVTFP